MLYCRVPTVALGVAPPPKTALVDEDTPPINLVEAVKSPKSVELPVVAISNVSITSEKDPPAVRPLVGELTDVGPCLAAVKSPKSTELPVEAIVKYSITLSAEGVLPPETIPLVELDKQLV